MYSLFIQINSIPGNTEIENINDQCICLLQILFIYVKKWLVTDVNNFTNEIDNIIDITKGNIKITDCGSLNNTLKQNNKTKPVILKLNVTP